MIIIASGSEDNLNYNRTDIISCLHPGQGSQSSTPGHKQLVGVTSGLCATDIALSQGCSDELKDSLDEMFSRVEVSGLTQLFTLDPYAN